MASHPCWGAGTGLDVPLPGLPSHVGWRRGMNDEPPEAETTEIEQRLRSVDEREEALDERECEIAARESQRTWLVDDVETVLTKAAQRDAQAASRDSAASKRDMTANMQAWLSGDEGRTDAEARQEALDDRLHSATDRAESTTDLEALANLAMTGTTDEDDPTTE